MAAAGHTVDLVCPLVDLQERFAVPTETSFAEGRLRIHLVDGCNNTRFGTGRQGLKKVLLPLLRGADCVHIHAFFSPWTDAAARLAIRAKKPYIIQPHGKLSPSMLASQRRAKRVYLLLFGNALLRSAHRVVVLAPAIASSIREWAPDLQLVVCPNGLNPEEYTLVEADANHPQNYLLYLGLIDPRKRIDLLLDALPEVRKRHPNIRLAVVGGDRYGHLARLQPRLDRLGASVLLPGHVSGDAKLRWLQNATLFLLPSDGEGLSLAMLEALVTGRPTLISRGCNAPEVQEAEAGEVIEAEPEAWARAITAWLDEPARMEAASKNARTLFATRFSLTEVRRQFEAIYRSACQKDHA